MRQLHDDDRGIAMITVLGVSMVLALLVTALLQYGVGSLRQARYDQDWHGALAAAQAGVDDFLTRINRDGDYWQDADQSGAKDPDNAALHGYATIQGGQSQFRYAIDTTELASTGIIHIVSDGRVNGVERTVAATTRRRGFLDYLYFTEYETLDPTAYPDSLRDRAAANCSRHRYDSPARNVNCSDIIWPTGDRVGGPFHSNDQIAINGSPEWSGLATTSKSDGTYLDTRTGNSCASSGSGCSSTPVFAKGFEFRAPLTLPPSNNQIKAEADPALSAAGCMYVGATSLKFKSNGEIRVKSAATDDPNPGKCPIDGDMSGVPSNGVIYVRGAKPSETCLSSPPHGYDLSGDITPYDNCAGDVFIEGTLDGRLTLAAENNIVITDDVVYEGGRSASGDDMLGLVANNFVEIMHPVRNRSNQYYKYVGEIVATGFIVASDCDYVYDDSGRRYCYVIANRTDDIRYQGGNRRFEDPHIDAAILSVGHSFRVQNHDRGAPFTSSIDLFGTIGQLYRGPTGTFNGSTLAQVTGYDKDYQYDPRLEYISPPHFLDPVQSAWSARSFSEE